MRTRQEDIPQFLLIVRERLRPGSEEAYNANELQLAGVCATLNCPHPYLALTPVAGPTEVWWFNAFVSQEERDALEPAYARNAPLMAAMAPLGKRKEDFRESFISTMTEYRRDSSGAVLRIAGARFFVLDPSPAVGHSSGALFESAQGERFMVASAHDRPAAEDIATRSGAGAMILAVQPQWSVPAAEWVDADPEFWRSNSVTRTPRAADVTSDDLTVRTATLDDSREIARVLVDGWQATYAGILPADFLASFNYAQHEAGTRAHLRELAASSAVFVAVDESAGIVGVALVRDAEGGPTGFSAELDALYVLPSVQRRGVGSRLFQTVVRWLQARGHQSVFVWVLRDNPYRQFYDRLAGELLNDLKSDDLGGTRVTSVAYGWRNLDALGARLGDANGPND